MKKKIIIICSVVAILLIAVGIYFLVRANNLKKYSNADTYKLNGEEITSVKAAIGEKKLVKYSSKSDTLELTFEDTEKEKSTEEYIQYLLDNGNYIVMGTLESYNQTRTYYGKENVVPIMLILDDATRLQRALDREKIQEFPQYEELCRRFLADTKDFSKEKMKEAGIKTFFENENLEDCLEKIKKCIRNTIY